MYSWIPIIETCWNITMPYTWLIRIFQDTSLYKSKILIEFLTLIENMSLGLMFNDYSFMPFAS